MIQSYLNKFGKYDCNNCSKQLKHYLLKNINGEGGLELYRCAQCKTLFKPDYNIEIIKPNLSKFTKEEIRKINTDNLRVIDLDTKKTDIDFEVTLEELVEDARS